MSEDRGRIGQISWIDLTVDDAASIRDFYCDVVGRQWQAHNMGAYDDFDIQPPGGETITGICHARDSNASMPPYWIIYITVEDVAASARRCIELGGRVLDGPRDMGGRQFCLIQDPAGAVAGLID